MRVALAAGMSNPFATGSSPEVAQPVLLWVFRRDFDSITCEVDVHPSGGCEVRVVPQWDPSLALVEPFERAADALHCHAELAQRLRDIGWTVADHVPVYPAAA